MSVFETTGLEAYAAENNPKYANQKIRQLKAWAKTIDFLSRSCKTQNAKILHADLPLSGIIQMIKVVVAERLHEPEYFRSLKCLIA